MVDHFQRHSGHALNHEHMAEGNLNHPLTDQEITHRTGLHCGSSAIRDLLEFHGICLTEAFCFGLGSGLGITYLKLGNGPVPYIVHVRSLGFEERLLTTIDPTMKWSTFESEGAATRYLNERLDVGKPALLLTDIFHLPYYGSSTHFPGHAIVAWRRDADSGQVLVTDTERPELLSVPEAKLTLARFSYQPPFIHLGNMYSPDHLTLDGVSLRDAARDAVRLNADLLLQGTECSGILAIAQWRKELPQWADTAEWRWTTRFAYQIIEKRGTGGGGFRLMYADFLDELATIDPAVQASTLPRLMRESAAAWTALAQTLKNASEGTSFPLIEIDTALSVVEHAEYRYALAAMRL